MIKRLNQRTILIEDVSANLHELISILQKRQDVELVGSADTVSGAIRLIKDVHPDLVLMDIQLLDGTAFDILENLKEQWASIPFRIIFVSAHGSGENALRAIQYAALEFIHKPFESIQLNAAIDRIYDVIDRDVYQQQLEVLLQTVREQHSLTSKLPVHATKGKVRFLNIEDILFVEADGAVCHFFLRNGQKCTAVKNLGTYSRILVEDYPFYRISNKHIINLLELGEYDHRALRVSITGGQTLPVSRRCSTEFKNYLNTRSRYSKAIQINQIRKWLTDLFGNSDQLTTEYSRI